MVEPNFVYYNYMNLLSQVEEIIKERKKDFIVLYDSKKKEIFQRGVTFENHSQVKFTNQINLNQISINGLTYNMVSLPVKTQNSETLWGYILYGRSLKEKTQLIAKVRTHLIYLSVVLFIFSFVILRFIIKKTTNPINALKKGLEMVSQGDLSYRININSNDEFFYLANKFNEMVEKLEKSIADIKNNQKDLENQIKDRTQSLDQTNQKLQKAMEELRNTQKKIIQSEKQKSLTAIVSGFAHEINNPLTGILGYINLMELRDDISPYMKEKLNNIKIQSNRIKDIIDELNQLNPEIDQTKLEINLANLLEKLVKIISSKKENQEIYFQKKIEDDNIIIFGNHFSLWQVFEGIMGNSIEAIKDKQIGKGKIEVILRKSVDNSRAMTEIIDNGGGFENIDKAFDPFYTTKDRTQKKGIGLSISYNLIQEHKGNILINNNDQGGATVTVYLPIFNKNVSNKQFK
jgi:signal transduction histidine kinase